MFAVITTEEYKDLLTAKNDLEQVSCELSFQDRKRQNAEDSLKELLLLITKGETETKWNDRKFESFDLAPLTQIADFINKNYVQKGILTFEKVEETANE